jgi:hypothetical protein
MSANTGTTVVCVGGTTTLSNSTTGTKVWTSSNTSIATVNASTGVVTGVASGTSTITCTLTDGSGCSSSANSTVTINPLPGAISLNNALSFDGVDDYVMSSSTTPNNTLSEFTIEGYIRPNASTQSEKGMLQWATSLTNATPFLNFKQDGTNLNIYVNGGYNLTTTLPLDIWSHVALVYTNSLYSLYINGSVVATYNGGLLNASSTAKIYLGNGNNGYWKGMLDEVRVWSVARTAKQISDYANIELVGSETGLMTYYNFNQGTADGSNSGVTTVTDRSTGGRTGTLYNFALTTGTTSNWVSTNTMADITGTTSICAPGAVATSNTQLSHPVAGGAWSSLNSAIA